MINNKQPWDSLHIGDNVIHKSYGSGRIVSIEEPYIDVLFMKHRAKFYYPDAFERGFLSIDNNSAESQTFETVPEEATSIIASGSVESAADNSAADNSIDYIQVAQELFDKYQTMSQLDKHRAEYYQKYGEDAYKQIYKQVQLLRKEAMEIEAKYAPSNCYSETELRDFRIVDYMLRKAHDANVRNQYNQLKSRYHSFVGIIAACYPHQMDNGRPAKLNKSSSTGANEWHSYKRISYASIEKIYISCLDHFFEKKGVNPIVEIHKEGESVSLSPNTQVVKHSTSFSIIDCIGLIEGAYENLETARDEEQEAYDNLPEGIQDSERGDAMQEYIDALDDAVSALDDVLSSLQDIETESDIDSDYPDNSSNVVFSPESVVFHKYFGQGTVLSNDGFSITVSFKHRTARFSLKDASIILSSN